MTAGIDGNWNGETGEQELPQRVYRIDGKTGQGDRGRPTAWSSGRTGSRSRPTRRILYVIESQPGVRAIYAFDVPTATSLPTAASSSTARRTRRRTASASTSTATCGAAGAWARAELDGVRIFNPQGKPIGHIALPERCANVCFGGPKRNRLFMAASHSIYALYVNTQGDAGRMMADACPGILAIFNNCRARPRGRVRGVVSARAPGGADRGAGLSAGPALRGGVGAAALFQFLPHAIGGRPEVSRPISNGSTIRRR